MSFGELRHSSPIVHRDHVILRLRNLVEDQSRMIVKLSNSKSYPHDNSTTLLPENTTSSSATNTHTSNTHTNTHTNTVSSPTSTLISSHSDEEQYQQAVVSDHEHEHEHEYEHEHEHAYSDTHSDSEKQQTVLGLSLKVKQLENIRDAEIEQKLQGTRLQMNRSSQRIQRKLQATIDRLRAEVVTGQKERLQLESKLNDRARDIITLKERCSEEKDKKSQLQLLLETQERSIWRMASQIEVGSPFSHLAQHATQPIVESLQRRLEELQLRLTTSESESRTANEKVSGLELNATIQKDRAVRAELMHEKAQNRVTSLQKEIKDTIVKWQTKHEAYVEKIRKDIQTLQKTNKDDRKAAQQVLEESEERHESTRVLLAEEKRLAEETMHKLSETEIKLVESEARVEELEERLANAMATAKKEYKDVVARLDEAVSRNEAREDSFSRHWTASNFRTAVAAGDAAATL